LLSRQTTSSFLLVPLLRPLTPVALFLLLDPRSSVRPSPSSVSRQVRRHRASSLYCRLSLWQRRLLRLSSRLPAETSVRQDMMDRCLGRPGCWSSRLGHISFFGSPSESPCMLTAWTEWSPWLLATFTGVSCSPPVGPKCIHTVPHLTSPAVPPSVRSPSHPLALSPIVITPTQSTSPSSMVLGPTSVFYQLDCLQGLH